MNSKNLAPNVLFILICNEVNSKSTVRNFPKGFQFGASTASYQIEGGWNEDGKGPSIWDVATHKIPSPILDGSNGDIAANSYHLYKRDVDIMKELGLDFYRFSISWSRILPKGFSYDWGQYANPIFSRDGDFPIELKNNIAAKSHEQGFPRSRLPLLTSSEVKFIRGTSDFFGLNTYTTKLAYRDASLEGMFAIPSYRDDMGAVLIKDDSWPQGQSTWLQEVPWGFHKLLLEIKNLYNNPPVYVTENGWSTAGGLIDDDRIRYLRNYLSAMLDAIDEGCNVKGYTVWSLMDNFEWLQGYSEKFGLYEVDFSNPDRPRIPRKSAFVYKEIIKSKRLDFDYEPVKYYEEVLESQEKTKNDSDDY